MAVRRRADAHGKQARVAQALLDHAKQLRLVANRAIGQKHDLPHAVHVAPAIERQIQRTGHLGAAIGTQALHPAHRVIDVAPAGRLGGGIQRRCRGIEFDDIKAILGIQARQGHGQGLTGLNDRRALHRAGGVNDVHHLARQALAHRARRRRHQHQQRVIAVLARLDKQRG